MNFLVTKLLPVALGGALGSSLRYLISNLSHSVFGKGFPYGTLSVNILGSLLIGYLLILVPESDSDPSLFRLFLFTGVLGGFTTYSAFSLETLQLFHAGQTHKAILNILLTLIVCFAAVWLGHLLAKAIHSG